VQLMEERDIELLSTIALARFQQEDEMTHSAEYRDRAGASNRRDEERFIPHHRCVQLLRALDQCAWLSNVLDDWFDNSIAMLAYFLVLFNRFLHIYYYFNCTYS